MQNQMNDICEKTGNASVSSNLASDTSMDTSTKNGDSSKKEQICKICGRQLGDKGWIKDHMCTDCWKQRMTWLRTFTAAYHERMKQCLSNHGVVVANPSTEGLDERGVSFHVPVFGISDCLPLRRDTKGIYGGDECGIFTVKVRGALLALPDDGVGIRFITEGSETDFIDTAEKIFHKGVLALASDGQELYGLTNDGLIRSTADGWKNLRLFDKLDEIRHMADSFFDLGTREKLVDEIINGKKWFYDAWEGEYYYDCDQKAFIRAYQTGCSHEGIYREFDVCGREELLNIMLRWKKIRDTADEIRSGKYPSVLIAAELPQHEQGIIIKVPDSYLLY